MEFVSRATMHLPPSQGDMGVVDFVSRLAALRLVHVGDLVSRGPAKWKVLASYWCGFSLRLVAPEMARLTVPHSDRLSPFYHSVLSSFRSYGDRVADWTKVKLRPLYPIILSCLETEPWSKKSAPICLGTPFGSALCALRNLPTNLPL